MIISELERYKNVHSALTFFKETFLFFIKTATGMEVPKGL